MEIDKNDVLEAEVQNGFLNFKPGIVGGHCIGVDPIILMYKPKSLAMTQRLFLRVERT